MLGASIPHCHQVKQRGEVTSLHTGPFGPSPADSIGCSQTSEVGGIDTLDEILMTLRDHFATADDGVHLHEVDADRPTHGTKKRLATCRGGRQRTLQNVENTGLVYVKSD